MNSKENNLKIKWNIKTHNKIALKYEKMHGEIYNEYEQSRLKNELTRAIAEIKTSSPIKLVLDYGCGAGNLTQHLSNLGCEVLACDVSKGFLDLVSSKKYPTKVITKKLNGIDLRDIPDSSVDMIAIYSVLHHIPDYLGIFNEFNRILKTGGIIYIDHEPSEEFWLKNPDYIEFTGKMKKITPLNIKKYFICTNYYDWLVRKIINPRYHREGDIHVFEDDHIEWSKIIKYLISIGGDVILSKSYLLFRRGYNKSLYEEYKDKITDMHVLIFKKL